MFIILIFTAAPLLAPVPDLHAENEEEELLAGEEEEEEGEGEDLERSLEAEALADEELLDATSLQQPLHSQVNHSLDVHDDQGLQHALENSIKDTGGVQSDDIKQRGSSLLEKQTSLSLKMSEISVPGDGNCLCNAFLLSRGENVIFSNSARNFRKCCSDTGLTLLEGGALDEAKVYNNWDIEDIRTCFESFGEDKKWDSNVSDYSLHLISFATGVSLLVIDLNLSDCFGVFPDQVFF